MLEANDFKRILNLVTIIMTILIIVFVIYGLKLGVFNDKMIMINFFRRCGFFAPLVLLLIQCIQVIFPVVPGGASCLAGVLAFGPVAGFWYNEIGLVLGSICAFYISRIYGKIIINKLFKPAQIAKYVSYIKTDKFDKIFFWVILLPGLPDDLLCYLAGISNIKFGKFLAIIILCKPLSLIMYSIFINYL